MPMDRTIIGVEIDITIRSGSDLVAKDGGGVFSKAKSSDPYVKMLLQGKEYGRTATVFKTLSPVWDHTLKIMLEGRAFKPDADLVFAIFDKDQMSKDDPMGEVRIPMANLLHGQVTEREYAVGASPGCTKVSGSLKLKTSVALRRALSLEPHQAVSVTDTRIAMGLGWDMLPGNVAVDLDASCVAIDKRGQIMTGETVYFGNLTSASGAIRHTGDEKEGDEDLGQGDDEIIILDLQRLPPNVMSLFFLVTVASPGCTFVDVKGASIRLVDWSSGVERVRYAPAMAGAHTCLFMARLARDGAAGWKLTTIGEVDHTARDWGTVVPELRAYMGDLCPGIKVDTSERIAVMRKGGNIRLADYSPGQLPQTVVLGCYWDVTNGVNIDLDASVIMLDASLQQLDIVFFKKLTSSDGAIRHGGDEREGDEKGDDEQIFIQLGIVHPSVAYIGLVINSYSGQELDDVKDAGVHLFDGATHRDIFRYEMSNTKELDKHTALVLSMLYRAPSSGEWCAQIIAEAAQGKTVHENVDELQNYIRRNPVQALAPARPPDPPGAGAAMVAKLSAPMAQAVVVAAPAAQMVPGSMVQGQVVVEALPIA